MKKDEIELCNDWQSVLDAPIGKVFFDEYDEGVRVVILRGPASINTYLGLPLDHPLSGKDYESIPLDCHGGLTFAKEGDGKYLPKEFWWYGWDYAHAGDALAFADKRAQQIDDEFPIEGGVRWTPKIVKDDAWSAIYEFKKLTKLAEQISSKTKKQQNERKQVNEATIKHASRFIRSGERS